MVEEDGKAAANKEEAPARRKMGSVVASEEEGLGREKMGDGSCRFGGAVVSSLAAGEREYENGSYGQLEWLERY